MANQAVTRNTNPILKGTTAISRYGFTFFQGMRNPLLFDAVMYPILLLCYHVDR